MYYINYSCLNKMINDTYAFIIILKRLILLSRKISYFRYKKRQDTNEANPNFWTDLKLYGLSSVFYRAQAI